jgi:Transposase.
VINNDTGRRLERIPSHQPPEIIEMLKKFKQVETVIRDFSKVYRVAIGEVLPNAQQIVD